MQCVQWPLPSNIDLVFLLRQLDVGVVVAAVRCVLWVALLLADKAWLTNNDASIAGLRLYS